MQGLKTNKQKKLCPAIVYVVVWGDGKQELKTYLTLHMKKKKKKNYTDALSFQCQDHHGLK